MLKIPDEEWEYAALLFYFHTYPRQSFLAREGERLNKLYSITKGLVRYYYSTDSGKEYNKYFVMDNRPFGSFSSQFLHLPCSFNIQALEDTEVLVIDENALEELNKRHSCWERLGRLFAVYFIHHLEEREKEFLINPLEIRYRQFLREFPGLDKRIPQYHIASYLGVTDVALSRLLSRKHKEQ